MAKNLTEEMKKLKRNLEKAQWGSGRLVRKYRPADYQAMIEKVLKVPQSTGLELSDELLERYQATIKIFVYQCGMKYKFNVKPEDRKGEPGEIAWEINNSEEARIRIGEQKAALEATLQWCRLYTEHIAHIDEATRRKMDLADQKGIKIGRRRPTAGPGTARRRT